MSGPTHECDEMPSGADFLTDGFVWDINFFLASTGTGLAMDADVNLYGVRFCPWCGERLPTVSEGR